MKVSGRSSVFLISFSALVAISISGCMNDEEPAIPTLSGTAAIGAPIANGAVVVKCAAGSPQTTTTTINGAWSVSLAGQTLPCALQVKYDGDEALHSVATAAGTANITPLTDLVVANLVKKAPAEWFGHLDSSSFHQITTNAINSSLNTVLEALNMNTRLTGLNPLTHAFKAVRGDPIDDALEVLQQAVKSLSIDYKTLQALMMQANPGIILQTLDTRTPISLSLEKIGGFTHTGGTSSAEITAYDPLSKRLFVVNGALGSVDVLDLTDPTKPTLIDSITTGIFGTGFGGVNSVAVYNGIVALAVEANPKTNNGVVAWLRAKDLTLLGTDVVGALPDMLTFTPDGKHLLVANEGEPSSYGKPDSIDPEGSISIIAISGLSPSATNLTRTVHTVGFAAFNNQINSLRAAGVRIYGPNATVAQDLEPEYIAVSDDSKTAYVTLQENNAIAIVDISSKTVTAMKPLGYKDHSLAGMGMDVSNEDAGINTNSGSPTVKIGSVPVKGLYMPDAIASYTINNQVYLITANEGDAREYDGFVEEVRVRDYCTNGLEQSNFGPDAVNLVYDSNLGRLLITRTPNGGVDGKNSAGRCTDLYSFGARSFSIWNSDVQRVFDSGDDFEQRTKALPNVNFNASNNNNTLDSRSPSKGPEPEGVTLGRIGNKVFAFIGLERVGGIMVYDVTNPIAPTFVTYINSRDNVNGDRGPEGITFVSAAASPNGKPLLIVGNETSGTTAIYQINLQY